MITQAKLDHVKLLAAQLDAEVAALIADPNPTTPASAPPAPAPGDMGTWSEYEGAFLGTHNFQSVVVDANGNPLSPSSPGAGYRSVTRDAMHGDVFWGDGLERRSIITAPSGEQWGIMEGYGNAAGAFYPVETVRADWTDLQTGSVRDITGMFIPGQKGSPEMPYLLPSSGRFRLREWFYLCSSPGGTETRDRPGYAEQLIEFGLTMNNAAWIGPGSKSRQAIKFFEAWWDANAGWVRATCPTLPWTNVPSKWPWVPTPNTLTPVEVNVNFLGWEACGRGAGVLWG